MEIKKLTAEFVLERLDLAQISIGIDNERALTSLLKSELCRGTEYFGAFVEQKCVGWISFWVDQEGIFSNAEPPRIMDLAVEKDFRRQKVASQLLEFACDRVEAAGFKRFMVTTGGSMFNARLFYVKNGFRQIACVPNWFGDGNSSDQAIFMKTFTGAKV